MNRKAFIIDVLAMTIGILLAEAYNSLSEYVRTKRIKRDGNIQGREESNKGSDRDGQAVD